MLCLSALSVGEYTEAHIHSSILYDRNLYRQSHEFCSSPYRYSLPWGLFSRRHTSLALPSEGFGKGGVKIRKLQKEKKKKNARRDITHGSFGSAWFVLMAFMLLHQAEYSYFSADFRLKIFLYYS